MTKFSFSAVLFLSLLLSIVSPAYGQNDATLHGQVTDPSGAIIPGATITLTGPGKSLSAQSDGAGTYTFHGVMPGTYTLGTTVAGFTPFSESGISIVPGQSKSLNVTLAIATQDQQVTITAEQQNVDTNPDTNANAMVIKGKALDALSDDPDQLSDELQALAGPAAGPSGGQIYIDGFTGGQLPPKSSIREIRVNQNPFSAEYDRLGYGRIEILTKPGTDKLHGQAQVAGNDSAFNGQNPILNRNLATGVPPLTEPPYYGYFMNGGVGGPITKWASYNVSFFARHNDNVSIVNTLVPDSTNNYENADGSINTTGVNFNAAYGNPSSRFNLNPRFDFALGPNNTLTVSYEYYRSSASNSGLGENSLLPQATDSVNEENTLTFSDTQVLSKSIVNDTRFRYRRIRDRQSAQNGTPSISVQGALSTGGNSEQTVQDHQNQYEFQDYATASHGNHAIHFGTRLRADNDVNLSESGTNGSYTFTSLGGYITALHNAALGQPATASQYSVTIVNKPTASATIFDAALYFQDDWKINDKLTFGYGLRYEAQNRIRDKWDFGPRFSVAYAVGNGKTPPKTVIRAGYGWFFNRFNAAGSFSSSSPTPYVITTIHQNNPFTGTPNQQGFTANSPSFLLVNPQDPNSAAMRQPDSSLTSKNSIPTYYTIDHHFHAALDMQAAIGVDHQFGKNTTSNVTYLYSQGDHQYLTNNVTAPILDLDTYTTTPDPAVATPQFNYQFQSEGFYRQNQIIATGNTRIKRLNIFGYYAYSRVKGDTNGATSQPSDPHNIGLDYGRTGYDTPQRGALLGNVSAPYGISVAPFLSFNAGTPFDITTGEDTSGNNQFNFRPTIAPLSGASCNASNNATLTPYGCLDLGTIAGHRLLPYGAGVGPYNIALNARMSKVIGIGHKVKGGGPGGGPPGGGRGPGGGGIGGRGLSGNQGGPGRMDQGTSRRYNLTLSAFATNVLNHTNLGTPNGVLLNRDTNGDTSVNPLFNRSQSLAGGFFGPSSAGNRSIYLSASFNF